MKESKSNLYARFFINNIPWLKSIPEVESLLHINGPSAEQSKTDDRDNAVMKAIRAIRNDEPESPCPGELLRGHYAQLPRTIAYIEWYERNFSGSPFPKGDGIIWGNAPHGKKYLNALDHAITYYITRGWGLSGAYSVDKTVYGYNNENPCHPDKDASIWLATVEALSLQQVIPAGNIPDDVVAEWGEDKLTEQEAAKLLQARRFDIKKHIRDKAINLLDEAVKETGGC